MPIVAVASSRRKWLAGRSRRLRAARWHLYAPALFARESAPVRKPARPFVTEYKSRKPAKSAAMFDESMMVGDMPSRDINADLDGQPSDTGYDARYEEALRAADSVFGVVRPASSEASSQALEKPQRTILSDLSYIDPVDERLAAAALVKRGRKTGSKNKKRVAVAYTSPEAAAVTPEPARTIPAPLRPQTVARHRPHVGFIKQLEARRSAKPGDKWKFKLRGR